VFSPPSSLRPAFRSSQVPGAYVSILDQAFRYGWLVHEVCRPPLARRYCETAAWYDLVVLRGMKTAISLSDDTFARAEQAARRLGVSRSEFFARAAERWLDDLDEQRTTEAINQALARTTQDTAFVDAAAARLTDPRHE
jgi:hypothetical protein